MNKKFLYLLIVISFISSLRAQGLEEVGWIAKFGLAGGFTPMWVMPNLDPVNQQLTSFGVENLPESGLITWGGSGYVYILMIDNVRIGGMGFGGSTSRTAHVGDYDKEVIYSIGAGALTIEYTLPFINKVAVSVGAMIGAGSADIELYQNNGKYDWDGTWGDFSDPDKSIKNINRKISNSFFTVSPTINIDIPVNRFMALRVGGGYLIPFSNRWSVENDVTLENTPSDLNSSSFFIQTGVFVGFFAF
ncbi:MAG: hypothetical protein V1720_18840 [bacterium]